MAIFDLIIEYGIVLLIVFTPLAFGSVHTWAYTTIELAICFLTMVWALKQIIKTIGHHNASHTLRRQKPQLGYNRFGLVKTPLNKPIVLFIGLVVFQLMPLPSGFLYSISPNTYDLYNNTVDQGRRTHDEGRMTKDKEQMTNDQGRNSEITSTKSSIVNRQSSNWFPLSIYPYATEIGLFKALAYIGMFFLMTNTPSIRIERIVVVIIGVGFCVSLLGILQKLTGIKDIYWVRDASYAAPFGPYVNRNHFAGYIGMVIPVALGLLVSRFASVTFFTNADRRSIVAKFQSHFFANLLLTFVIVIMISALFLSLSRGGIMSFAVAVVAFCALIGFIRLRAIMNRGWRIMASVLVITFVFLLWLGLNPVLNRLSDISPGERYDVYLDTINMTKDFPIFGTGIGSFQYIYPRHKTLQSQLYYDHAHNDYLELISDSGLAGFLIVLSGFIMFFWKTLSRWWERRHHYAKGVGLGGVCGIIAILAHSFTDFNLHIPANALLLSIILGLTHNAVNMKIGD